MSFTGLTRAELLRPVAPFSPLPLTLHPHPLKIPVGSVIKCLIPSPTLSLHWCIIRSGKACFQANRPNKCYYWDSASPGCTIVTRALANLARAFLQSLEVLRGTQSGIESLEPELPSCSTGGSGPPPGCASLFPWWQVAIPGAIWRAWLVFHMGLLVSARVGKGCGPPSPEHRRLTAAVHPRCPGLAIPMIGVC